jgi:xanthine dehydrogenase small subunit
VAADMNRESAFILNNSQVRISLPAGTVLLDFIRRGQQLTGTREGCREGDCGACTVLLGRRENGRVRYRAVVSCLLPLDEVSGCHVVTIEGLNGKELNPIQQAVVSEGGSQCGFCTPGIVVSLTGYLLNSRKLLSDEAITAIEGNICRCTGYTSLKRAVERLLRDVRPRLLTAPERLEALVTLGVLPDYFTAIPQSLEAFVTAARKAPAARKAGAVTVAGGTDLYVQRGEELPGRELLFLSRQEGLAGIWPAADRIFIGAATPVAEIMDSPLLLGALPMLAGYLRLVSSVQIRNRATIGGNIVNASPIGDLSVIFLALNARIGLRSAKGSREMALRDFFRGYKKLALRKNEIVAWISIPISHNGILFNFEKVARRRYQDIAAVNSAIGLEMDGERITAAHVAAGGVAPVPLYLRNASAFLAGKTVAAPVVRELAALAGKEIAPISDVRGSASYKRLLLQRLLSAHFLMLFPDAFAPGELP